MGIKELAKAVGSFEDPDWHQDGLGGNFYRCAGGMRETFRV
jgi:hypothetical protein